MGAVVYHWDDLRHSAFDNTPLRLAAIAGSDCFYYCIAEHDLKPTAVKGFQAGKHFHFFDKPLRYLDKLVGEDPLLCADFTAVEIAVRGVPFVVMQYDIPGEQFARSQLSAITDIGPSDTILLDTTDAGLQLGYVVPQPILDEANQWFSAAKFRHVMTTLITWCIDASGLTPDPILLVNSTTAFVEIVLCAGGRMYFGNHFRVSATEDILYFVLAVLEDQETDLQSVQVKCSGPAAAATLAKLQDYLPRCDVFAYPGTAYGGDFPAVESADLMSILRCGS